MHNGTGRNARIKELQRRVTEKAVERAALTKEWVIDKLRENFRFGCPGSPRRRRRGMVDAANDRQNSFSAFGSVGRTPLAARQ